MRRRKKPVDKTEYWLGVIWGIYSGLLLAGLFLAHILKQGE